MISVNPGKSIRIFLADGTVTGIRHGEIVNWTGQALYVPRSRFSELKNWHEACKPGVYFLFGEDDSSGDPLAYIGEAEDVRSRLQNHVSNKEFWNEAVLFTNKDENLTKAHVRYLEARLVQSAKAAGRYRLENGNAPQMPSLPRCDRAAMDEFFENLRLLLGALGHKLLEAVGRPRLTDASIDADEPKPQELIMQRSGLVARAQWTDEGIVVLPGSQATDDIRSSLSDGYRKLRDRLIVSGVLQSQGNGYVFAKEYLFSSPSAAGAMVCGQACNGREYWKDGEGRMLKELEEAGLI